MSTSGSGDPEAGMASIQRYREGKPPRDEVERAAYEEWSALDADHAQSWWEEVGSIDVAYEQYNGPLDFVAFREEYLRQETLASLGIEQPELPRLYSSALGPERVERLQRRIEDILIGLPVDVSSPEFRAARTRELLAARRELNVPLGEQVVALEARRDSLQGLYSDAHNEAADMEGAMGGYDEGPERDQLGAAAAARALEADVFGEQLDEVDNELAVLSEHKDHPDRWLERHEGEVATAFAVRQQLEQERTLEAAREQQAGPEISHEATTGVEAHEPLAVEHDAPRAGMDMG